MTFTSQRYRPEDPMELVPYTVEVPMTEIMREHQEWMKVDAMAHRAAEEWDPMADPYESPFN